MHYLQLTSAMQSRSKHDLNCTSPAAHTGDLPSIAAVMCPPQFPMKPASPAMPFEYEAVGNYPDPADEKNPTNPTNPSRGDVRHASARSRQTQGRMGLVACCLSLLGVSVEAWQKRGRRGARRVDGEAQGEAQRRSRVARDTRGRCCSASCPGDRGVGGWLLFSARCMVAGT
jgi:hypothetical protein